MTDIERRIALGGLITVQIACVVITVGAVFELVKMLTALF